MKAYSEDLRQRIVEAVERGMPRAEVVSTFRVSLATIKRYLKQQRDTGHLTPRPRPGRPATTGAALTAQLDRLLLADPDATLDDLCQRWQTLSGLRVSVATMSRAIRRLGWTRKKRRWVRLSATSSSGRPSGSELPNDPPTPLSSSMNVAPIST
jgi:transposase